MVKEKKNLKGSKKLKKDLNDPEEKRDLNDIKCPGCLSILLLKTAIGQHNRLLLLLDNQRLNNLITMDQRSLLVTLLLVSTILQAKSTRNWVGCFN